ncbi:MAG: S8 family serine peptidase [Phycisphaerae bacterium]
MTTAFARFIALVCVGLAAWPVNSQIQWRSGATPTVQRTAADRAQALADAVRAGERHVVIQFAAPVTDELRAKLNDAGVSLQAWLSDNAFFARLNDGVDAGMLGDIDTLTDLQRVHTIWKLHPTFARREVPTWAIVPAPQNARPIAVGELWVAVYVLFHADVTAAESSALAAAHDALIASDLYTVNGLVLEMPLAQVELLAGSDAVMYVEPALPPQTVTNDGNRAITQANIVQAAPYGLNGAGVNVLVYDGGTALASHVDFQGRLTPRDNSGLITHATHVCGTIGGAGVANSLYRGMAPAVTFQSYGYEQAGGLHQGFLYTDPGDLQNDYNQAINVYGADISNNSIGTNTAANGFPCGWEGDYGVTDTVIDSIVRGGLGAPFRVIWANGNERGSARCGSTYHTTAPPACAKNHIAVGALNSNDDSVSYFTSWGPADDGRLKPDISAPGCQVGGDGGVTSCGTASNSAYITYCGTSMASPTVCGLASLVLQDFRAAHPGQPDPRNSTLKVLFAHTAQDVDAPGPDYKTGYGSVRVQRAIDFLRTGNFFEASLSQGQVNRVLAVVSPGSSELKVTLAWDDPPGTPNVTPALVNDLDIVALDPAGVQHFPWTLGGVANPAAPAVQTAADHVNNIEQVYVASPAAGVWTIEIRGFNVPVGPQPFSACVSPSYSGDCNNNGINDLTDIANGTSVDCNLNSIPDECELGADCNHNGVPDACDISGGSSQDVNGNRIPDECEPDCNGNQIPDDWDISTGFSQDCNGNYRPDECDIASGSSEDCDHNGIPDECEPDCNQNGAPDLCDIADGTSHDCNQDGIPDECEQDCNLNGVADGCDIANGTSLDLNGDGYPDECDRLFVNELAGGSGTGWTWPDAFPTLDGALQYCSLNRGVREIWIATGYYSPPTSGTFVIRSGLTLYGGFAGTESDLGERDIWTNATTLSGSFGANVAHVVTATNVVASTILDGLFIEGGSGGPSGGGLIIQGGSPTIQNCYFYGNTADRGGAVSVAGAAASFIDCIFESNAAVADDGGAIRSSGPGSLTLTRCWFYLNAATEAEGFRGRGGAVYNGAGCALNITGCYFDTNYVDNVDLESEAMGGALANAAGGAWVQDSVFFNGSANLGGGVYSSASITLANCMLVGNLATDPFDGVGGVTAGLGGAIYGETAATVTLKSCTIAANWAHKKAGGAQMSGAFQNTIVWNNVTLSPSLGGDDLAPIEMQYQGNVSVRYSDVEGLLTGIPGENPPDPASFPGSTEAEPLFAIAPVMDGSGYLIDPGDEHLSPGSPCIDAGENASVPASVLFDLDGLPRFYDDPGAPNTGSGAPPIVDMGAFESVPYVPCPGDLDGDREVGTSDLGILLAAWDVDAGGDLDGDGVTGASDLGILLGYWDVVCP